MNCQLHHVGHVVKNLEEGMKLYEKLGLVPDRQMEFHEIKTKMVFYPFGGTEIELIEPGDVEGNPAFKCLQERGEGIFHLSFRVDDYDAKVKALREKGFTVNELTHEKPDRTVRLAFLVPEEVNGLWIEFIG